jgi:hypothetical protein
MRMLGYINLLAYLEARHLAIVSLRQPLAIVTIIIESSIAIA